MEILAITAALLALIYALVNHLRFKKAFIKINRTSRFQLPKYSQIK